MGKVATFGEKARKIISGLKFNYVKEDEFSLGKVDFGVLTVAASGDLKAIRAFILNG